MFASPPKQKKVHLLGLLTMPPALGAGLDSYASNMFIDTPVRCRPWLKPASRTETSVSVWFGCLNFEEHSRLHSCQHRASVSGRWCLCCGSLCCQKLEKASMGRKKNVRWLSTSLLAPMGDDQVVVLQRSWRTNPRCVDPGQGHRGVEHRHRLLAPFQWGSVEPSWL